MVGEELILPLSGLEERFPLTRTSQPPPPWTSGGQALPVYLHEWRDSTLQLNIMYSYVCIPQMQISCIVFIL